ncbi:unnamed protein product [Amoebophrya sp. A25]|nr:unnamed protein product [Amoebophrya sp. A25]|eukprot:GSA25T00009734001.1
MRPVLYTSHWGRVTSHHRSSLVVFRNNAQSSTTENPSRRCFSSDVPKFNCYSVLEVSQGASSADIKKAYLDMAKKHHPDCGGNSEKFRKISEAYETLSRNRAAHDQVHSNSRSSAPSSGPRASSSSSGPNSRTSGFSAGGFTTGGFSTGGGNPFNMGSSNFDFGAFGRGSSPFGDSPFGDFDPFAFRNPRTSNYRSNTSSTHKMNNNKDKGSSSSSSGSASSTSGGASTNKANTKTRTSAASSSSTSSNKHSRRNHNRNMAPGGAGTWEDDADFPEYMHSAYGDRASMKGRSSPFSDVDDSFHYDNGQWWWEEDEAFEAFVRDRMEAVNRSGGAASKQGSGRRQKKRKMVFEDLYMDWDEHVFEQVRESQRKRQERRKNRDSTGCSGGVRSSTATPNNSNSAMKTKEKNKNSKNSSSTTSSGGSTSSTSTSTNEAGKNKGSPSTSSTGAKQEQRRKEERTSSASCNSTSTSSGRNTESDRKKNQTTCKEDTTGKSAPSASSAATKDHSNSEREHKNSAEIKRAAHFTSAATSSGKYPDSPLLLRVTCVDYPRIAGVYARIVGGLNRDQRVRNSAGKLCSLWSIRDVYERLPAVGSRSWTKSSTGDVHVGTSDTGDRAGTCFFTWEESSPSGEPAGGTFSTSLLHAGFCGPKKEKNTGDGHINDSRKHDRKTPFHRKGGVSDSFQELQRAFVRNLTSANSVALVEGVVAATTCAKSGDATRDGAGAGTGTETESERAPSASSACHVPCGPASIHYVGTKVALCSRKEQHAEIFMKWSSFDIPQDEQEVAAEENVADDAKNRITVLIEDENAPAEYVSDPSLWSFSALEFFVRSRALIAPDTVLTEKQEFVQLVYEFLTAADSAERLRPGYQDYRQDEDSVRSKEEVEGTAPPERGDEKNILNSEPKEESTTDHSFANDEEFTATCSGSFDYDQWAKDHDFCGSNEEGDVDYPKHEDDKCSSGNKSQSSPSSTSSKKQSRSEGINCNSKANKSNAASDCDHERDKSKRRREKREFRRQRNRYNDDFHAFAHDGSFDDFFVVDPDTGRRKKMRRLMRPEIVRPRLPRKQRGKRMGHGGHWDLFYY